MAETTIDVLVITRHELENEVRGALKQTIDAHGDISKEFITSATKRIAGQIQSRSLVKPVHIID